MMASESKSLWDTMATASKAHGEHNDCTVMALTAATGCSYDDCHAALQQAGRKNRRGCQFPTIGKRAAKSLGFLMEELDYRDYSAKTMITAERDRRLATGKYVIRVRGHVAALVDGKVVDWSAGRRHRINNIYTFTAIDKAPEWAAPAKRPAGTETWRSFRKYTKRDNLELF
jgi:hypothetical protein